jgi:hypothetical protein
MEMLREEYVQTQGKGSGTEFERQDAVIVVLCMSVEEMAKSYNDL